MGTQTMVERLSYIKHKIKNQSLSRYWPLDRRSCFGQGIKWDAPLGLDFGLYHPKVPTLEFVLVQVVVRN